MKRVIFALALLLLSCTSSSCGTLGKVDWPKLVQCGPSVNDLVGSVSRVLLEDGTDATVGDRARNELEQLAADHGADIISCIVHHLVNDWTSPGAAQEPTRMAGAERGRAFLAEKQVEVSEP